MFQVTKKEAMAFASHHGLLYNEASAVQPGTSLAKVFREPCRKALDRARQTPCNKEELWGMGTCVGRLHKNYSCFSESIESDVQDLEKEEDRQPEGKKKCCC